VRKGKIISRLIFAYLFSLILISAVFVYVALQDPKSDLSKVVQIIYMTFVIVFTLGLMIFVLWYSKKMCKQIEAQINLLNKKYAE
jgi:polyferredoxin